MEASTAKLERDILKLGQMVETAISRAIICFVRRDRFMAQAVIKEDADIDRTEVEVEEQCLRILEAERPSGLDLRFVVAVLKINDSLERIGDLAENVARIVVEVGDWERFQLVAGINEIAEKVQKMVKTSLTALVSRDPLLAQQVIASDDDVDAAHRRVQGLIEMEMERIPENASPLMKLESVTRQFERIGDVSCNIAEEVIYLVDGRIVRHSKSIRR
jgi:phosphate transport system protein